MPKYLFTITREHVRNILPRDREQYRKLHEAIGPVQTQDIGKRVYDCGGFFQVENNEQRDARSAL